MSGWPSVCLSITWYPIRNEPQQGRSPTDVLSVVSLIYGQNLSKNTGLTGLYALMMVPRDRHPLQEQKQWMVAVAFLHHLFRPALRVCVCVYRSISESRLCGCNTQLHQQKERPIEEEPAGGGQDKKKSNPAYCCCFHRAIICTRQTHHHI